ncbi:MAG: hypothetical protein LBC53_06900 [Spirochaetaceae bacterium]|jgi:hypothetical protein|nr:hypothetical protein [Spirochaetaceae bacterium]
MKKWIFAVVALFYLMLTGCAGNPKQLLENHREYGYGRQWGTWYGYVLVSDENFDYAVFYDENKIEINILAFIEKTPRLIYLAEAWYALVGNELIITSSLRINPDISRQRIHTRGEFSVGPVTRKDGKWFFELFVARDPYEHPKIVLQDGREINGKEIPFVNISGGGYADALGPFMYAGSIAIGDPLKSEPQAPPKSADYLARGIAAEESGRFGIAGYWYDNAWYYSSNNSKEALLRRLLLSKKIYSDITGNSIQIKLETEKRRSALRKEIEDFFKANNPFLQEFILDLSEQRLSEPEINRQDMTATYTFQFGAGGFGGYSQTDGGILGDRGFVTNNLALDAMKAWDISADIHTLYLCQAELVNGNGAVIARTEEPPARFTKFSRGDYGCLNIFQTGIRQPRGASELLYTSYAYTYNPGWQAYNWQGYPHGVTFTAPIADVTDTGMKARIIKVFQYTDPDDNGGVFELIKTTDLTR